MAPRHVIAVFVLVHSDLRATLGESATPDHFHFVNPIDITTALASLTGGCISFLIMLILSG
jgi:hypothetical protein